MSKLKWWQFFCDDGQCSATFGYQGNASDATTQMELDGWAVQYNGRHHLCPEHKPVRHDPFSAHPVTDALQAWREQRAQYGQQGDDYDG